MEVILKEDVKNLGAAYQVVKVRDGYGRNFLLPRGLALLASESNRKILAETMKQKAFKLKEDIRLYTGEDMQTEVLSIQARQVLDFSAAYDVIDSATRMKVGALKRKGMRMKYPATMMSKQKP